MSNYTTEDLKKEFEEATSTSMYKCNPTSREIFLFNKIVYLTNELTDLKKKLELVEGEG